jgi:peptidoglycan hydrolase-like protein with peptidoglycan-binding domain
VRNRRTASPRSDRGRDHEVVGWLAARLTVLRNIGWGARDTVAFAVGVVGSVAILVNALFLQSGPHPAPLFKAALAPGEATNSVVAPRPRPAEPAPGKIELASTKSEPATVKAQPLHAKTEVPAVARPPAEIMADIQRELARRGFYDGSIDGVHGPKTDSALRDLEQAAGLKPSLQVNEALLQTIVKSSIEAPRTASASSPSPAAAPGRKDAIGDMLSSSRRVIELQRALAQYGYGQIKPTGIVDAETRAAIEKFERERKLPVTGEPSDRVARELAGLTGRSLD